MRKNLPMVLLAFLLGLACSTPGAQSIRVGPARPGGDPTSISTNVYPGPPLSLFPLAQNVNAGVQGAGIVVTGANLTNFIDFTVTDPNFVDVQLNGFTGWSTANNFQTNTLHCAVNDDVGVASTAPCNSLWITTSVQGPNTLRITANRSNAGDSTVSALANVVVTELNPALVRYVTRGTAATGAPATVTNCPNILRMSVTSLGIDGIDIHSYVNKNDNTHVGVNNGFSGNDFAGVTGAYQVICWN